MVAGAGRLLSNPCDRPVVETSFDVRTCLITRNGREAAVLLSAVDLAELEETLSVLSDPQALADIREADAAYVRGDVIRGGEAVRALRS